MLKRLVRSDDLKTYKDIALVAVCVALVAGIAFFGWHFFSGKYEEFNAVAKPIIVDVADSGWSNEAVGRHASPALKRQVDDLPTRMRSLPCARWAGSRPTRVFDLSIRTRGTERQPFRSLPKLSSSTARRMS